MLKNSSRRKHMSWIAWRNIVSRKRKSGLSFMTVVSILGVAFGVFTLIVVLSVMGGFELDLQKKLLRGEPHLEVNAESTSMGFSLNEFSDKDLGKLVPEAVGIEPFIKTDVVLKHRKHLQSSVLHGIDPKRPSHLWVFSATMTEGQLSALADRHRPIISESDDGKAWPGVVLGEVLAGNLGVDIGDEVVLINPQAALGSSGAMGASTTLKRFVVVGTFHSGDSAADSKWAITSLPEARKFMADYDSSLDADRYVTGLALNLKDPYRVDEIAARLKNLKGLKTLTWKMANKSLLFALKLEKFAMGSILMLIVVVAAFSISGTMMMTVFHRRQQVSLLRALGMTKLDIGKLYMMHGAAIGTVGIILGLFAGLAACWLISKLPGIPLPAGIYKLKNLPVRYIPDAYVVICISAGAFALLASSIPALTAARQSPGAGLRFE